MGEADVAQYSMIKLQSLRDLGILDPASCTVIFLPPTRMHPSWSICNGACGGWISRLLRNLLEQEIAETACQSTSLMRGCGLNTLMAIRCSSLEFLEFWSSNLSFYSTFQKVGVDQI